MHNILALDGVHFSYGEEDPVVLEDLSLNIPAGKVTAILGPNGTGKTTMLHIMLGLLKPFRGGVAVAGKPHKDYSKRELSQMIGLVPQFESIPFNFSVIEYVLLGRSPYLNPFQLPQVLSVTRLFWPWPKLAARSQALLASIRFRGSSAITVWLIISMFHVPVM